MFADPERVHPIDHAGRFFTVRGPLNVPRPPQGQPVLLHRDPADERGTAFAASTADVLLSRHRSLTQAGARRLARRCARQAATADDLRCVADVMAILAETEAAAHGARQSSTRWRRRTPVMPRFVGTPAQFAALLAEWHAAGACDGFNILPAVLPDRSRPAGRRRGAAAAQRAALFAQRATTGTTLREHLGLQRAAQPIRGLAERTRP